MGLLDIHADDLKQSFDRQLRNPAPAPGPDSFSGWSFAAAGVKGPVSGVLESAASTSDLLSGVGTVAAATGMSREGMFSTGTDEEKKQAAEARDRLIKGNTFDTSAGNLLRRRADEFAPDPESATKADQVIHGLTRSVSKAVVDVATLGVVPGAAVFGLDEGNNATQRLRMKGVDTVTAAKVGAVTGAISGVTVAIPGVGPTIKSTIGLAATTGPAAFVAQEAFVRDILQRAGEKDEASLHDPLDPLGLTLSTLLPGVVGGMRIRSLVKADRIKTEADVKKAVQLTPSEQAASDAYERSAGNLQELRAAIAAEKNPESKVLLQAELDKQTALAKKYGSEVERSASDAEVVDAARVRVAEEALTRSLPPHETARMEVVQATDMVAAGQMDRLPRTEAYVAPKADDIHIASLPEEARTVMADMYAAAAREKAGFDNNLRAIADELGLSTRLAGLKGTDKAVAKVANDYGGDPTKIKDLLRGTIVSESADAAQRAVGAIFERFEVLPSGRRNLLDPGIETADGYRDAKFNVLVNGHVAEIQVNLPSMIAAKDKAHGLYNERVKIEQAAAGRLRTKAEEAQIASLNEQMKAIYAPAWAEAMSARKAEASTGEPLRLADSGENSRGSARSQAADENGQPGTLPSDTGMPSTSKSSALPNDLGMRDAGFMGTSAHSLRPSEAKVVADDLVVTRARAIAEAKPDLKVRLPGTDETLTVAEALKRAKEEADYEAGEASLVRAAMECALGFV